MKHAREVEKEVRERNRFAVLLHVATLRKAGMSSVAVLHIGSALALETVELRELIEDLTYHGLLATVGGGARVTLAPAGGEYLRAGAGRRRSVRLAARAA